jgi:hypothetical protein
MISARLQAFAVARISGILSARYGELVAVSIYCEEFRATFARPTTAAAFAAAHKRATWGNLTVCLTHPVIKKIIGE